MKQVELLLPGEKVLDRLKFRSFYRPGLLVLTDRRILVSGHTGALGNQFTLLRGSMVSGFPLEEFESFIIGTGKRPLLLLLAIVLAIGGGVMLTAPWARSGGMAVLILALLSLIAWIGWLRTFITVSSRGLKISGMVKLCEAVVFLERMQLSAAAAKAGKTREEIRAAALSSGLPRPEKAPDGKDLVPKEDWACEREPQGRSV